MDLEPHHPIIQRYFNNLIKSVHESSEAFQTGYYYENSPEEQAITEIHQLENSKASKMINLNIKHRV